MTGFRTAVTTGKNKAKHSTPIAAYSVGQTTNAAKSGMTAFLLYSSKYVARTPARACPQSRRNVVVTLYNAPTTEKK